MRYLKTFALALGLVVPGASTLLAQDCRDLRHDYASAARLRYDIARDRNQVNRDLYQGRYYAAARQQAGIARDRRALNNQVRDIRHDWRERY